MLALGSKKSQLMIRLETLDYRGDTVEDNRSIKQV